MERFDLCIINGRFWGDGWNGNTIGIGAFQFTGQGSDDGSNLMAIFADGATTETIDSGSSKQVQL